MMFGQKRICLLAALGVAFVLGARSSRGESIVTFDDLPLAPNSFWIGPDPAGTVVAGPYGPVNVGQFTSTGVSFVNRYDLTFGSWSGFAYSNMTDTTTPGFTNSLSAITGSGRGPGDDNYGVAFGSRDLEPNLFNPVPFDPTDVNQLLALPSFELPSGFAIEGMYVTNTTYAALSMQFGDSFAKKFGGATGNDPDWFKLTAYGTDESGTPLSAFVEFYLADFRFADNTLDYIIRDWVYMDLSALSGARRIHFNLSSSDIGAFGMNTPAYFAIDDIRLRTLSVIPEPSSWALALAGLSILGVVGRLTGMRGRRSQPCGSRQ
jgi:hypothetical protein